MSPGETTTRTCKIAKGGVGTREPSQYSCGENTNLIKIMGAFGIVHCEDESKRAGNNDIKPIEDYGLEDK